jgi:hypothetical protein
MKVGLTTGGGIAGLAPRKLGEITDEEAPELIAQLKRLLKANAFGAARRDAGSADAMLTVLHIDGQDVPVDEASASDGVLDFVDSLRATIRARHGAR